MHVYRFRQANRGIYVYDNVMSFDLTCPVGLLLSHTPRLLKILWKVKVGIGAHG